MRSFTAAVLGALLAGGASAFSPSASRAGGSSKILANLKEMRMTGAGGAASPDQQYVEGESGRRPTATTTLGERHI